MKRFRQSFPAYCVTLALMIAPAVWAQGDPGVAAASGSIEFVARVTPTGARAEPVRQFTFYLLRKSYSEITREAEQERSRPDFGQFVDGLPLSDKLKAWIKQRQVLDLTHPDFVQLLSTDDILDVPEFLDAYLKANSGGVTSGLPRAKYSESERARDPEKYERQKQDYTTALRKFIESHPQTRTGMEVPLDAISPHRRWAQLEAGHRRWLLRRAPELAQTRYLAARTDTDLEGRAVLTNIPAGTYWLSTLGLKAAAGDSRLRWDVEVTVRPGETSRLELTNLNAAEEPAPAP